MTGFSIRVANLYRSGTNPGPALDFYDTAPGTAGLTPIISNLAYGAVSDYVHPKAIGGGITYLYALPAGSPSTDSNDAKQAWTSTGDDSDAHVTVVLTSNDSNNGGPLGSISSNAIFEKGGDATGPLAPPPPSGQGELLANDLAVQGGDNDLSIATFYLLIDNSCTPAINAPPEESAAPQVDTNGTTSQYALFAVSPGTHQAAAVSGEGTNTCASLQGKGTASNFAVAAGQEYWAFLYGPTQSDVHVVVAPIAS